MRATAASQRPLDRLVAAIASNPLLVDALIALGLTALSLITVLGGAQDIGQIEPVSLTLLLLQTLPLVLRRRAPIPVFAVTMGATVLQAMLATATINSTMGSLVALYTVAEQEDRRRSAIAALAGGLAIGMLIVVAAGIPAGLSGLIQSELSVFVVWLLGTWARERRRYLGTVEERALRAEQEREARAERAVADERDRIAREMHDVVTHHVSVIVIQAGAGLRALDRRPEDARAALTAIDGSGRTALADMRRLLGILGRPATPGGDAGDGGDALAPMPGLDRLGELIEHVRSAGLPVEVSVAGEPRPLDAGVELAAYRIIQEALTNSLKHARGATARVDVRFEPRVLEVEVEDKGGQGDADGGVRVPDGLGRGLIGMRERVAMFDGRLEAGPTPRGFRVLARLPVDGRSARPAAGA